MSRRKRVSLSVRLQPYSDSLLAEVVNWLNSMDKGEANRLIGEALLMAYLPYARADRGEPRDEIERCCWETTDRLNSHGFMMRQALRVAQPQFYADSQPLARTDSNYSETVVRADGSPSAPLLNQPTQPNHKNQPQSRLSAIGDASQVSSVFGDDD